jgi:hypothetical protein
MPISACLDEPTGTVPVGSWKTNLVAEDDEPTSNLRGSENDTVESLAVFAVSFGRLKDQLGGCLRLGLDGRDLGVPCNE